jgi:hypothetical protein
MQRKLCLSDQERRQLEPWRKDFALENARRKHLKKQARKRYEARAKDHQLSSAILS